MPMQTPVSTRRFPRVPVRGTVRALLRRVSEADAVPVTLREVSEGGLCVILPGVVPENGARVTVEMALWRQVLYLPANIVWSRPWGAWTVCGLKLHLEVTDGATRRAYAGWVRNQAAPERGLPKPVPERPYEKDAEHTDAVVVNEPKSRAEELFEWIFRRSR